MVQINAMRPGLGFGAPRDGTQTSKSSHNINWWTVIKVTLIIVAVAAAAYFAHTVVIPAIAKVVDVVGTTVATTGVAAANVAEATTSAVTWVGAGMPISVGGGVSTGIPIVNTIKTMLKPIQYVKYVIDAASETFATKVTAIPFAAAGGGGFAW